MAPPKDYQVISRRPPFKGLSLAQNETGTEKGFATELSNIEFQRVTGPENESLSQRPGWRQLGAFSKTYTDFTEFRDRLNWDSGVDNAPAVKAQLSGAMLFGPGGAETWAPARVVYYNPNKHVVQILPYLLSGYIYVTVNGTALSPFSIVGTVTSLTAALAPYGIVLRDITSSLYSGMGTTHFATNTENTDAIALGSLEPAFTDNEYLYIRCRQLMSQASGTLFGDPASPTHAAGRLPALLYKSVLTPSNVLHRYVSTEGTVGASFISDGNFQEQIGLSVSGSATPTAGASFYDYAFQVKYAPIRDTTLLNYAGLQGVDAETYVGGLSSRTAVASATLPITLQFLASGMGYRAFLVSNRIDTNNPTAGIDKFNYYYNSTNTPLVAAFGAPRAKNPVFSETSPSGSIAVSYGSGSSNMAHHTGPVLNTFGAGLGAKIIVWRTKAQTTAAAASTAVLYKVAEIIPSAASRSYVDSVADGSLTEVYLPRPVEPTGNTFAMAAVRSSAGTFHQGRAIIGSENGLLYFSLPDELQNFNPDVNSLFFNTGITALASLNDVLYVWCKDGLYAVTGTIGTLDSSVIFLGGFTLQKGVASAQGSVCVGNNEVFFIGEDETAYVVSGADVKPLAQYQISSDITLLADQKLLSSGTNYFDSSVTADLKYIGPLHSRIRTTFCKNTQEYAVGVVGNTYVDVIDAERRWSRYSLPLKSTLQDLGTLEGQLTTLVGTVGGSQLYVLDRNFIIGYDSTTDPAAFATGKYGWKYASCWEDLGDSRTEKQFVKLQVDMPSPNSSQGANLDVTIEYDWEVGNPGQKVSFPLRVNQGWGNSPWGDVPWGDKNQVNCVIPLSQEKHRSMRVIFEGTTNLAISGWSIEVAGAGAHAKQGAPSNQWVA